MTDPFTPPAGDPPSPYGAPQGFGPPPPQAPLYGDPYGPPAKKNGFGVTALVLGIVGLLFFWVPGLGLLLGVLAIVFAVLGRKRVSRHEADNGGMAVAGLVMGILGALAGAAVLVVVVLFAGNISDYTQCVTDAGGNPELEQLCEDKLTEDITN